MIQPMLRDEAFLADVRNASSDRQHFHLWWLGQSGFLVQWQGRHLLLDPYLSDSLTKKYAATDKPHVRMTERVIAPERLNFIDVVTSSHNHTDHLDAETLKPLLRVNEKLELIIPEANREFVADRLGIVTDLPVGLDAGQAASVAGFKLTGVPAAHETVEGTRATAANFLATSSSLGRGPFITAATRSFTRAWWTGCADGTSTLPCFRSTDAHPNDASREISTAKKQRFWPRKSARVWSFLAIMRCSSSTRPARRNSFGPPCKFGSRIVS